MAVIDSYSEANKDTDASIGPVNTKVGQSFTNTSSSTLGSAQFWLRNTTGATGNAVVSIYAHSGTYGTSSQGTGTALATSDNLDVTTIGTSYSLITFTFSGANKIALTASTNYVVVLEWSSANSLNVGVDSTAPSHSGNYTNFALGSWNYDNTVDACFYVNDSPAGLAITTNAVTNIASTTATGNGNITDVTSGNADERGIVYSTSTQAAPGNVAPGSSGYSGLVNETGSFSTGAFTESLTGLSPATRYYARAYAHNSTDGYIYGDEVNFITGLEVAWFTA